MYEVNIFLASPGSATSQPTCTPISSSTPVVQSKRHLGKCFIKQAASSSIKQTVFSYFVMINNV